MLTLQLDVMILMFTLFTISTAWTSPTNVRQSRVKDSILLLRSSSNDINDEVKTRRKMIDESIKASTMMATTSIFYHYPNVVYAAETKACDPGDTRCRQGGVLGEEPIGKSCSLYEQYLGIIYLWISFH